MSYRKNGTLLATTLLFSFILFSSCSNFLSPEPESFTSKSQSLQTPGDFEAILNGAYNRLREQAPISEWESMYMLEIRADAINRQFNVNLPFGDRQGQQMEEWTMTTANQGVLNQWTKIYDTIQQTNTILQNIDNTQFEDQNQKSRIKGEAKFIRALSYWYAVQYWGDVPLILNEVSSREDAIPDEGRTSVDEVYSQIISDLQEAISELPKSAAQPGRADEGAARFLLGRTYLLTEDYSSAIELLESVTSNFNYTLLPNYENIWDPSNTNNNESIFELQFSNNIASQPSADLISKILPHNSTGEIVTSQVNALGWYHPSHELFNMINEDDERLKANIKWWEKSGNNRFPDVSLAGDSIAIINKFFWPNSITEEGEQAGNVILFRYSDALLSLAEAYWRDNPSENEGEVLNLINQVRARAGLPEVDLNNVPVPDILDGTFLENDPLGRALFIERSIELFAEGHRFFDLKRFGDDFALTVMRNYADSRKEREPRLQGVMNIQSHKLLFPIPGSEANLAGLQQNSGW